MWSDSPRRGCSACEAFDVNRWFVGVIMPEFRGPAGDGYAADALLSPTSAVNALF